MKTVSENSESDLAKHAASEAFDQALVALTINMLRIIAGAGEPARLLRDIHECALAMQTYREAHNQYPSAFQIAELLDLDKYDDERRESWSEEDRKRWEADGTFMVQFAAAHVRQASLRVVAAQWAGHRTVLTNADNLFSDAIKSYIEAWEFRRRENSKPTIRHRSTASPRRGFRSKK